MNVIRAKKFKQDVVGIIGIVIAASVLLSVIGFFVYQYASVEQIDKVTFCPESGHRSHYAILIDSTDPLNNLQTRAIEKELEKIIDETGQFDRLSEYVLEEEFDTEIPDEDAEKIATVQNAIDYINSNLT
mgnify:CR=1 FL=1